MGTEPHHGRRRSDDVPTRRALKHLRRFRAGVAALVLAALAANAAGAASANDSDGPPLDPRFAALLKSRPCGTSTVPAPERTSAADVAAFVALDGATPTPATLAQATSAPATSASATPAPATSATATTGPATGGTDAPSGSGASSSDAASPLPAPSAGPSLIPIPPVPPTAPQQIVPPTPRPTGSATASPVPLPTAVPSPSESGPIFIVRPTGSPAPIAPKGASPAPTGSASPEPSANPTAAAFPEPTLGPYQIVTIADQLAGSSDQTKPSDLYGNVHIFYTEGQVVGDRAHFDGGHTITVSGHAYLINRNQDSILYADEIAFDTQTRRATLIGGSGETVEGVQRGKLHYTAEKLTARTDGVSHGDRASFSTCEHPHAGYHVEARSIDVTPGSKIVARKAVVFLGPTAIFYIPLLVIPLVEAYDQRRQASFLPVIGYNKTEGFFIKARIGFAPSDTYYGYYRVEYFTKRGLGLGYAAFLGSKDQRRSATIDSYTIDDKLQGARTTNVNVRETENFNRRLRGQFGFDYVGDYGPNLSLPATINVTGSIVHQGNASTENLTFSRFLRGPLSDNFDFGFLDSIVVSQAIGQQINLTYSKFNSEISSSNTLHISTNTHVFTKFADYNLAYDKTDYSTNPFGYDRLPELQVLPHLNYGSLKFGPQLQFALGRYTEPQNHFTTTRAQGQLDESVFFKVLGNSDLSAHYNLVQDYYGTGDAKAYDQQNASLNTPIGNHFVNSLTYNEQHPIGPANVPFQLFDRLSPGAHSAQDTFRVYNRDVYSLSLATGTSFNRQAQTVSYQLNVRPSPKSYLVVGGFFQPGPGLGFASTNVQAITPFGRDTTLEFTTNIDWTNHSRLTSKNIYLSRTVDNCYNLQLAYNEDLKQFTFNVVILAFPGQSAGFGLGGNQSTPIIPQNFTL